MILGQHVVLEVHYALGIQLESHMISPNLMIIYIWATIASDNMLVMWESIQNIYTIVG